MNTKNITLPLGQFIDTSMDNLLHELSHYKEQSEHLKKINELYQRMSGILDLPTMLEAYSIWLAAYVRHELIGYRNPAKKRMHMYCSFHGPQRRQIVSVAETVLSRPLESEERCVVSDDFHSYTWAFESADCYGMLVLTRQGAAIDEAELFLVDQSLAVLADPLKRALDYEEVFSQARKDSLTGLANRAVFEERIDSIIEQARRYNHPLTLASIDLDHFKSVNDAMGHLVGDRVLKQVAGVMNGQVRATDLLVRMGGDEFILVLPNTDIIAAQNIAARLCDSIDRLNITTVSGKLAVSIGLASWEQHLSRQQWIEHADDILYQAKANGRNQVMVN
ncbi:MAG: GGDEF domain-containing protein [Desulfobulbus propionicus]|nr:MAG: GGDEF domain-containing protein [Desulfobulbus propionicus]